MSYLEIYNEDVRDLLGKDQNAKLEVCEVKKYIVAGCVILYQLGFKVPVEKIRKLIAALISVPWFPFIKNYVGTTIRFFVLLIKNYFYHLCLGKGETRHWCVCERFVIICYE